MRHVVAGFTSADIQAAVDAGAGNGVVIVPDGVYQMDQDVVLPSNTVIRAEGHPVLVVSRKGAAAGFIVNPGTEKVSIRGLDIRGPWYGQDPLTYVGGGNLAVWNAEYANNCGIEIRGRHYQREQLGYTKAQMEALTDESSGIWIEQCDIAGFGQSSILADQIFGLTVRKNRLLCSGRDGLRMYGVIDGDVDRNEIGGFFAAYSDGEAPNYNMYGVAATRLYGKAGYEDPNLTIGRPSQDISVTGNHIHDIPTWKGLDTHGGVRIRFEGNFVRDCNIGCGLDKGGYDAVTGIAPARQISVIGNHFWQTRASRYMRAAITSYGHDGASQLLDGITITGNHFTDWGGGDTDSCIALSNTKNATVTGNVFTRPRLSAIRASAVTDGFTFTGNTVDSPVAYNTVAVTAGGSGYTARPDVVVSGGGGTGMRVYANISAGAVTSLKLLHPGWDYTSAPTLTITGSDGTGATASATYVLPFGVQIASATVRGVVDGNTFTAQQAFPIVRLSTPSTGHGVLIGADNVVSGAATAPTPANLIQGSMVTASRAWANVNLGATTATLRSSTGIVSVSRTGPGKAQLVLTRPLTQGITGIPIATGLGGTAGTATGSLVDPSTLEVTVVDAWGAPKDASFFVTLAGY